MYVCSSPVITGKLQILRVKVQSGQDANDPAVKAAMLDKVCPNPNPNPSFTVILHCVFLITAVRTWVFITLVMWCFIIYLYRGYVSLFCITESLTTCSGFRLSRCSVITGTSQWTGESNRLDWCLRRLKSILLYFIKVKVRCERLMFIVNQTSRMEEIRSLFIFSLVL